MRRAAAGLALALAAGCAGPGGVPEGVPAGPGSAITSLGDARGRYRLVVRRFCSDETCFSRAFLQQVEGGPRAGGVRVVRTEAIREINGAPVFVRSFRALAEPGLENVFELVIAPTVDAREQRIVRIHPLADGGYAFEFPEPSTP